MRLRVLCSLAISFIIIGKGDSRTTTNCKDVKFSQDHVTVRNGTSMTILYTVDYARGDAGDHVDFSSTGNADRSQVVLRMRFKPDKTSDNTTVEFTSLRPDEENKMETVGAAQSRLINMNGDTKLKIVLLVNDTHYTFAISNNKDRTRITRMTRKHHIAYQTISIIHADKEETGVLSLDFCSPIDECKGVCVTCPRGTSIKHLDQAPLDSVIYNNTHSCRECEKGESSEGENRDSCTACKAGTYAPDFGSKQCAECPAGEYSATTGAASCLSCPAGTFSHVSGSGNCAVCTAGYKLDASPGGRRCTPCAVGTYSQGQTTSCTKCAKDTVTVSTGSVKCEECAAGALNHTHCTCKAGTYRQDNIQCAECETGSYAPSDNMVRCVCSAGYHRVGEKCVRSTVCKAGQYKEEGGTCTDCPTGTYSSTGDTCTSCPSGHYQDKAGQTKCAPCAPGTAQHQPRATSCEICHTGTFQDQPGERLCKFCHGTVDRNQCLEDVFNCPRITATFANIGTLTWPSAEDRDIMRVKCPFGGEAERRCVERNWLDPDLTKCNSKSTRDIEKVIEELEAEDQEKATAAVRDIVEEKVMEMGPKDIESISKALSHVSLDSSEVAENVLKSTSEITKYDNSLQHAIPPSTKARVVSLLEGSLDYLVKERKLTQLQTYNNQNIQIHINTDNQQPIQDEGQQVEINQNATFSSIFYKNSKLFSVDKSSDLLTSEVFGINVHGTELTDGFKVAMKFRLDVSGTAECRYYNTDALRWATEGCYVVSRDTENLYCQCNHLTSFAVFTSLSEVPPAHRRAQSMITTFLFVLSILTMLLTLAVYIPIRSLRSKMIIQIEMMEVIALICANATFLLLAHVQHQAKACTGLIFAVQYFYLVTMAWSFVAAWTFYGQIVNAIHSYGKSYQHTFLISCILCWTLPAVFPTFALVYSNTYNTPYVADIDGEFGCWISETWKTYTFILPILVVVFLNTVLGIRVIMVMLKAKSNNKNTDSWETHKRHIKSIISLLTLFGTSFLLSLFTYGPHAIVFQYLFICLTCSQGLFIFIFFVPLRPEVHSEWKTFMNRQTNASAVSPRLSERTESSSVLSRRFSGLRRISTRFGLTEDNKYGVRKEIVNQYINE